MSCGVLCVYTQCGICYRAGGTRAWHAVFSSQLVGTLVDLSSTLRLVAHSMEIPICRACVCALAAG